MGQSQPTQVQHYMTNVIWSPLVKPSNKHRQCLKMICSC